MLRIYDALPVAAGWTGALLALALAAFFFAVEAAMGRTPIRLEGAPLSHSGEALITLMLCGLLAYLCTATEHRDS